RTVASRRHVPGLPRWGTSRFLSTRVMPLAGPTPPANKPKLSSKAAGIPAGARRGEGAIAGLGRRLPGGEKVLQLADGFFDLAGKQEHLIASGARRAQVKIQPVGKQHVSDADAPAAGRAETGIEDVGRRWCGAGAQAVLSHLEPAGGPVQGGGFGHTECLAAA